MPSTMHCTCRTVLSDIFAQSISRSNAVPPSFLIPGFLTQKSTFSTSTAFSLRKHGNPSHGESALRRTGLSPRRSLPVKLTNLPKPVLEGRSEVQVDENHGLWAFFPSNKNAMLTPEEMHAHGRAWKVSELRGKSWNDLHKLWWVCIKDLNRMKTSKFELGRCKNDLYGGYEYKERKAQILKTMRGIKQALTERWYAWEDARQLAVSDPEVDYSAVAPATGFVPAGESEEASVAYAQAEGGQQQPEAIDSAQQSPPSQVPPSQQTPRKLW